MTRNPRTARGGITLDMLFGRTKPVTPVAGRIVIGTADGENCARQLRGPHTRARILSLLASSDEPPLTDTIGQALGLTPAAIRHHLRKLERANAVHNIATIKADGRPASAWRTGRRPA